MNDHSELKRLAEAAGGEKWKLGGSGFVVTDERGADIKPVADFLANPEPDVWTSGPTLSEAMARAKFSAAFNPARVLALLAEIAALRGELDSTRGLLREWDNALGVDKDRATQAERQRDEAVKQISMDDVRLAAGEGPLGASTVLAAVNAIIRTRANRYASMEPKT